MKLYQAIARTFVAYQGCCSDSANESQKEWIPKHRARIEALVKEGMPSGSGFDSGTTFDFEESNAEKLVFRTSFHHMNDVGSYDGWTEHAVTVRPSLAFGFLVSVSGRNRNQIKDYIGEVFQNDLDQEGYTL